MQEKVSVVLKDKQEIFTHVDDDGTRRMFPIGNMTDFVLQYVGKCADIICVKGQIGKDQIDFIKQANGIEQERLDRLCDPYLHYPCFAILWGEDAKVDPVTVIDGNHRMVKLFEQGEREVKLVIFKRSLWEQFLFSEEIVDKVFEEKPDLMTDRSGVIEFEQGKL